MPKYRLYNRVKQVFFLTDIETSTLEEALAIAGWTLEQTWIRQYVTDKINPDSGICGGGWKNITPRYLK